MLTNSATNNLQHAFTQLGMTDEHADVYLAALELGNAPPSTIAKKAKVPRTTTYDILDELKDWGFVIENDDRNKKFYIASDPERIEEQMIFKRNRVADITFSLKKDLYQLESIYAQNQPESPKTVTFEGIDSIEDVLFDCLLSREIMIISGGYKLDDDGILPEYLDEFYREIKVKSIKTKEILADSESSRKRVADMKGYKGAMITVLPEKESSLIVDFEKIITDDLVLIINHSTRTVLKHESDWLCEFEKQQFELVWNTLQKK